MCQQLYSQLQRDESATNRLLINPIQVDRRGENGTRLI